jgi:hypothetical protein
MTKQPILPVRDVSKVRLTSGVSKGLSKFGQALGLRVLAATAWEQSAFRAGPLTASLPAVTVSEPIVAAVLGVTVLGETLNTNNVGRIALGVLAAVMAAATVALARSQAAAAPRPGDERPGPTSTIA